jgi:hypothetical protein
MIAADDDEAEGDEKILETIKKIQEEAEEEEEDSGWDDKEDGDNGFCGCLMEACFEIGVELFWEYAIHLRFAPYPYAPSVGYNFSALDYHDFSNQKVACFNLASDLSTHFDGTYGNTNRLTAQLTGAQLNVFNQTIFASSVSLETVSINAGLSLLIGDFDLSGFAGAYIVATTGTGYVSAGISSRIFFPARLYLDLYGLYAFVSEDRGILHLIGSLNFAIWRFSVGAGYNYNNYLGDVYAGPCLKISFWF